MKKLYLNIMVHICWTLEDVYDFLEGLFLKEAHASNFYPSAKYENELMLLEKKEK
jgi:hypothetical protein